MNKRRWIYGLLGCVGLAGIVSFFVYHPSSKWVSPSQPSNSQSENSTVVTNDHTNRSKEPTSNDNSNSPSDQNSQSDKPPSSTQNHAESKDSTVAAPSPPVNSQAEKLPAPESVQQVQGKYWPQLSALRSDCENQLNQLVASSLTNYHQQQSTGGSISAKAALAGYMNQAAQLEDQCQNQFNALVDQMQNELKANGLPTDLIDQAQSEYYNAIDTKKAELTQKVKSGLGIT